MINVIGLGYIGLPTALMMASHGVEVIGTDYNKELVATLNAGKTTFKEDGLDELFAAALRTHALRQVQQESRCVLCGGGGEGSDESLPKRCHCGR